MIMHGVLTATGGGVRIKLWGTRGSLPRSFTHQEYRDSLLRLLQIAGERGIEDVSALRDFVQQQENQPLTYGGNTTCTEIRHQNRSYVVDLGTGLASFAETRRAETKFCFFLSHLHWDHILGLPFFPQLYERKCEIDIYHLHDTVPEYLRIKFNGVNFPVKWEDLSAQINFHKLRPHQPHKFDALTVTPFQLDHPGDAFGYRFDSPEASVGIAVDNELKRKTAAELGKDHVCYQRLDFLLFDSQYELSELAMKYDWGHSSPASGIDLAFREMIKNLVLVHHDPAADDQKLAQKLINAREYAAEVYPQHRERWEQVQPGGPRIISGYDGMEIDVT